MIKKILLTIAPLTVATSAFAQSTESWHAKTLGEALGYCALFGLLGAALVVIGFKAFDKVISRIDIEGEILKGNVAAAILGGAVVIGLAIIIAAAMT